MLKHGRLAWAGHAGNIAALKGPVPCSLMTSRQCWLEGLLALNRKECPPLTLKAASKLALTISDQKPFLVVLEHTVLSV